MKPLEKLRLLVFWLKDFVTGSSIRKHYNDLDTILMKCTADERDLIHRKCLIDLIKHSVTNCHFYKAYKDKYSLSDFPVVNKYIIKENQTSFLADNYKDKKLYSVTTSGSTGTPFRTYHDRNKKQRNYADTIFFARLAGYEVGQRLIYMKIWVREKMKHRSEYWLQNIIPVDVIHLNDAKIELLIRKMEQDRSSFSILAYSSALELVCQFLERKNSPPIKTKVKSIIAISESLNDYTRSLMLKYFGTTVVSRYSNLENGILAQQESDSNGMYLINSASYHVEILKMESDEPAGEGILGRIVVTDLFNYAAPMIRYDTGDIGAIEPGKSDNSRQYLSKVEGRKLDLLFDTGGNLVSSYIVYKNMWQYTEIDQYQLIQETERKYTFKINCKTVFLKENQLIAEFKFYLGTDADFSVEYVKEIPLLASGKRKKIVNNMINTPI